MISDMEVVGYRRRLIHPSLRLHPAVQNAQNAQRAVVLAEVEDVARLGEGVDAFGDVRPGVLQAEVAGQPNLHYPALRLRAARLDARSVSKSCLDNITVTSLPSSFSR